MTHSRLAHSSTQVTLMFVVCLAAVSAHAQIGAVTGPPLQTLAPVQEFATSDEHYQYLLGKANGGTQHTIDTIPRWDGLWYTAGNNHMDLFIDGGLAGGSVREGVLTPAYETAYKE